MALKFALPLTELTRRHHRSHRERKENYIKDLEREIVQLRESHSTALREREAQIAYLNHFLDDPSSWTQAESLFKRFLTASPGVELFKFYLKYVRSVARAQI